MSPNHPTRKAYETFWAAVYAFPDPTDKEQYDLIKMIGYMDNVQQEIVIHTPDYQKLENVRKEAERNRAENPKMTSIFSIALLNE